MPRNAARLPTTSTSGSPSLIVIPYKDAKRLLQLLPNASECCEGPRFTQFRWVLRGGGRDHVFWTHIERNAGRVSDSVPHFKKLHEDIRAFWRLVCEQGGMSDEARFAVDLIEKRMKQKTGEYFGLDDLFGTMQNLIEAADLAKRDLEQAMAGNAAGFHEGGTFAMTVCKLADLWTECAGKQPKVWFDSAKETASPFTRFMIEFNDLLPLEARATHVAQKSWARRLKPIVKAWSESKD